MQGVLLLLLILNSGARAATSGADMLNSAEPIRPTEVSTSYVADEANFLNERERLELNAMLARHNQKGAGEIYLCLIEELPEGMTAKSYANSRKWNFRVLTSTDYDKRVLLLVVAKEKWIWISTSPGGNNALTDEECLHTTRDIIRPLLNAGKYRAGITAGINHISQELLADREMMKANSAYGFFALTGLAARSIAQNALDILSVLLLWGGAIFLLIAIHEAGHAIVARMMGLSVTWVTIGCGKELFVFHLAGVRVQIHALPFGGATAVSIPPDFRGNRAVAMACALFAGPGTHLVIMLLFMVGGIDAKETGLEKGLLSDFISHFYHFNALNLLVNLLPVKQLDMQGLALSDGYRLLRLLTHRAEEIETFQRVFYVFQADEYKRKERYAEAVAIYQQGLLMHPESPMLLLPMSEVQRRLGDYAASRETLLSTWDLFQEAKYAALRPIILNDLAYNAALSGKADWLAEGDKHSQEAMRLMAHEPAIIGTRGAMLLRMGQIEEGLRLLFVAYNRYKLPEQRAEEACWLALGEALRHNFTVADHWWQVAQAGKPKAYLVNALQRELQLLYTQQYSYSQAAPTIKTQPALAH